MQSDGNGRYRIHMRSSLHAGEYCPVNSGRNIFYRVFRFLERIGNDSFAEDQCASWPAKRFVRRGHHHVESMVQRIRQYSCRDESADMRDVGKSYCSDFLCYLYEFFVIELSGISGESCQDDLGFVFMS